LFKSKGFFSKKTFFHILADQIFTAGSKLLSIPYSSLF